MTEFSHTSDNVQYSSRTLSVVLLLYSSFTNSSLGLNDSNNKKKTMINLIEVLQRNWTNCDSKNNRCRHQMWCWNENTALPTNFQWEPMRPSCSYSRWWQLPQTFSVTGFRLNFTVATVHVMLRLSITCLAMPHNCRTTMPPLTQHQLQSKLSLSD